MFKNILVLVMLVTLTGAFNQSYAAISNVPQNSNYINIENIDDDNQEADRIQKVSFREKFKKSPETQINNFFKKYNKYSEKNEIEKLKELYSDDFVNNDGFTKSVIFKMMDTAYTNVKYKTEIQKVSVTGNTAIVKVYETAMGETVRPIAKLNDKGQIKSEIYYIDYLRKEGTDWKITNSNILSEKVELKYGEAKNSEIEIQAPECVTEGSEYEVTVNTKTPDGVFVVGSIVNEPIVYPQIQNKDVFRAIKSESIARIVKANTAGYNEYATVSMAITRAKVEPTSVVIDMTGMVFAMKRVNVFSINKDIKIKEK